MNLPEDDRVFLRDLVKATRQKPHHVNWTDRDGSARVTTFSQAEAVRLNSLAHKLGVGKPELMRQAAHIPAAKSSPPANSGASKAASGTADSDSAA